MVLRSPSRTIYVPRLCQRPALLRCFVVRLFARIFHTVDQPYPTEFTSPFDATVVQLLRESGADLVGKTNCDEFGMGYACILLCWTTLTQNMTDL